jgi:hypothetical protein
MIRNRVRTTENRSINRSPVAHHAGRPRPDAGALAETLAVDVVS